MVFNNKHQLAGANLRGTTVAGMTISSVNPRTSFWRVTAGVALFAMWLPSSALTGAPPNIVLIVSDDQARNTMSVMPMLGSIDAKWITFSNGFTTTPLCSPSRASILTGQYAHHHGVLSNIEPHGISGFRDHETLATWLTMAGYKTGFVGKYFNEYQPSPENPYIPPGWDTFRAFVGHSNYYDYELTQYVDGVEKDPMYHGIGLADYSTDVLRDYALEFIRSCDAVDSQPFFLQVAPNAPHSPCIPAPRHVNVLNGIPPHRPPTFNEADVRDKPYWVQAQPRLNRKQIADLDSMRCQQLETLLAVDEMVESLMEALVEYGELENTIVIYLSDDGTMWGEHRLEGKRTPYEECLHIPFMVFDGRHPRAATLDQLVLNIDVAPTILELAEFPIPSTMDGRSFAGLLDGDRCELRADFLFEDPVKNYIGIHTKDWVYITDGPNELYDLKADPYQLTNVANLPANSQRLAKFQKRLEQYLQDAQPD